MMKRCVPIFVVFLFGLWIGCGGNEEGPTDNDGTTTLRLVADTTVNEPTLSSPDEAMWSSVDSVTVPVSGSNRPKLKPPEAAAIPPNVIVKAIKKSGKLYLHLQWSDTSFNAYPDNYEVDNIIPTTPQTVRFKQNDHEVTEEDQIFLMFDGLPEGGYDVWNWRVLTTGGMGLGKGYNYPTTVSQLVADAAGTTADSGIITNPAWAGDEPTYAHKDTSEFGGHLLYTTDTVNYQQVLDSIYDEYLEEWIDVYFYNTTGWDTGQIVPCWLVDSSFASLGEQARGSRWDIKSASEYDSTSDDYQVVLCRELNTGYTDDMDLSAVDSVKVKIGIYDAQEEFGEQTNRRGFSDDFWIILPE